MVEFLAAMYALYYAGLKLGVARGALATKTPSVFLRIAKPQSPR